MAAPVNLPRNFQNDTGHCDARVPRRNVLGGARAGSGGGRAGAVDRRAAAVGRVVSRDLPGIARAAGKGPSSVAAYILESGCEQCCRLRRPARSFRGLLVLPAPHF